MDRLNGGFLSWKYTGLVNTRSWWWSGYEQKKAIEQRQRVHRLYFSEGYSKTVIAKQLGVSKGLVVR
ncbi:MAG: hypothetical protein O7F70_04595, partial [Gemmatimonadetes bacterium]|nr:hypothetical protein [Gemmatimonadota bacterium]